MLRGNSAVASFSRIAPNDLEKIMSGSSWIPTLIASVHNLPIGFALSNGHKDTYGFPLIYVNKYFEKMTGKGKTLPLEVFAACATTKVII
jgi:hypothetical protein